MTSMHDDDVIDQIVTAAMKRQRIPGLAILAAKDRRIVFARGYGLRNIGEGLLVNERTSFSIASISKQFTAAAIMQLLERGQIALADPVSRYLSWFNQAPDVTVAHLLSHTSGIPSYSESDSFDLRCYTYATAREIVESVIDGFPVFEPGDEWQYSNTNYVLLGALLEVIEQRSYDVVMRERVLRSIDTPATGVNDPATIYGNVALGFSSYCLGPWEPAREWDASWAFASAGLRSNALDLFAWNVAMRSGKIVSDASRREMERPTELTGGKTVPYGFGLQVGQTPIGRIVRHVGGLPGFTLDNASFPDREIDVIVLANIDGTGTQSSITWPVAALLGGQTVAATAEDAGHKDASETHSATRDDALSLVNDTLAGRLGADRLTGRFRRFLSPARRARLLQVLQEWGPVRALHPIETSRRFPQCSYTYRAEFNTRELRAELAVRDDGCVDGFWLWSPER